MKLTFVPASMSRPALLVAENLQVRAFRKPPKTGTCQFRKASKTRLRTGRGLTSVPVFLLLRQTRLRKRLDPEKAGRDALNALPSDIDAAFRILDVGGGNG